MVCEEPGGMRVTGRYMTGPAAVFRFVPLLNGAEPLPDSSFSASSEVGSALAARYARITATATDGRPLDQMVGASCCRA